MPRANFTLKVRKLIESAAGHHCSFPACNQRTSGPGATSEYLSNSGYAAHIYSASSGGPRGQGGLSDAELKGAGNGIWLCGRHAKLVDNNKGNAYPPEALHSYKALHEARVLLEHEGLYPPIGWLHELTIVQSPLFSTTQKVQLSKLNLIYGMNCTGKTAITEWITGFFDPKILARWTPATIQPLILRLSLLNPKLQYLGVTIDGKKLQYFIDSRPVAFIPIGFKIFKPDRLDFSIQDDREMLAQALLLPLVTIDSLINEVNSFPHAKASNLRFELDIDDDGNSNDRLILRADVQGTVPGLALRGLSGREGECIVLELATAAARLSGKYCPTLLVLDDSLSIVFEGFFDFYSHHLLDPLNQFQTLMCIPERDIDLDNVKWNGWQVIRTNGKVPTVTLTQDVRTDV
jgi:hypothetical protein